MTREEFIEVLKDKGYPYMIRGNKVVVTDEGDVHLQSLTSLPPGVSFRNEGGVDLRSLTSLSPGVEFRNEGYVYLDSLIGGFFSEWEGNIEGVNSKRLLNLMISKGLFL